MASSMEWKPKQYWLETLSFEALVDCNPLGCWTWTIWERSKLNPQLKKCHTTKQLFETDEDAKTDCEATIARLQKER